MSPILFATTNKDKLRIAQAACKPAGLAVENIILEVDEIQGEDPVLIVRDKARRAYEQVQKPLVVSDDSWSIPALRGFPGAYMKSMNHWFTTDDFLRLMSGINDRRITLHQYLAYIDEGGEITVFQNALHGQILEAPRGHNEKAPHMAITVLDADGDKSIAEVFADHDAQETLAARYQKYGDVWHKFIDWWVSDSGRKSHRHQA